jgi:hypothetical protein
MDQEIPEILKKYNTLPGLSGDKHQEYSRLKNNLYNEFGHLDPKDYDLWVDEVTRILEI